MFTIFNWIFTIFYIWRIQIFSCIRTIWTTNVHYFPLNILDIIHSTNLNFSMNMDFLYTSVHNFSLNFHDFVHLTNSNFSTNQDVMFIKCTWFCIVFSWYHTFKVFKFFHVFGLSVHLMYLIFLWILTISYIQQIQFFSWIWSIYTSNVLNFSREFSGYCTFNGFEFYYESGLFVHPMYTIFHWIFPIS